jgi:hypothetical protein
MSIWASLACDAADGRETRKTSDRDLMWGAHEARALEEFSSVTARALADAMVARVDVRRTGRDGLSPRLAGAVGHRVLMQCREPVPDGNWFRFVSTLSVWQRTSFSSDEERRLPPLSSLDVGAGVEGEETDHRRSPCW